MPDKIIDNLSAVCFAIKVNVNELMSSERTHNLRNIYS